VHDGVNTSATRSLQDAALLRDMKIDPNRHDTLIAHCVGCPEEILRSAYVQRDEQGNVSALMLPPRHLHTRPARAWLRKALGLLRPDAPPSPPRNLDGTPAADELIKQFISEATSGSSALDPLTIAVYATDSISISLPPSGHSDYSFALRLKYSHALLGNFCLNALRTRLAVVIRRWPWPRPERRRADTGH
jgi:hypothetical protein